MPLGSSEFGPVLGKIRDAKPNFIFSTVVGASDIAFHKQFKQEGFDVDTMPIASLTTGEIETRAMGNEFGAGHFLSAPYFQALDNPTNHKFVESFLKSKYGKNGVRTTTWRRRTCPPTCLSTGWRSSQEERQHRRHHLADDPRRSGGVRVEADVSPEGPIWIDDQNFNTWLKPKIGQCQADGSFKIVKEAPENVAPDPYSIYPTAGKCTADGLKAPDGKIRKNVI